MAGKSLLQQFGWGSGSQKAKENLFTNKLNIMEGGYRKSGGSDNEPPSKKRKTEDKMAAEEADDDWDDSIDFTEADLDDIEFQASQAITQTKHETKVVPSTSSSSSQRVLQPLQQVKTTESKFVKPQLSRSSSSSASSKTQSLQSAGVGSMSSQSKSSVQSSKSSYPESLSGYSRTTSSSSVRSGSSSDSVQGSKQRTDSRNVSIDSQATISELNVKKQELAALKLKLDNLQQEVFVKEGENKVLRDNLTSKDRELDSLKMEKISQIHQQNLQQSERERNLQAEMSRLQTQLEFKSQEERELTNRCQELQIQLRNAQLSAQPSTSTSTQSVSPQPKRIPVEERSPRPKRIPVDERSPRGQSMFPSQRTFMAEEVSPIKRIQPTPSGDHQPVMSTISEASKLQKSRRTFGLKLHVSSRICSGPQLVAKLFDIAPNKTGNISDKGIFSLLSSPTTNTGSYRIPFERDKNTSLLSPVRGRRLSDLHGMLTRVDRQQNFVNLVPVDHFNMAVEGLSNLIKNENQSSCDQTMDVTQSTVLHDAILVLPIINDYLKHYMDMLDTTLETSDVSPPSTTVSSSSSGSFDTSSESLTGSFGLFVKMSASSANDLEQLTIASVETLYELLSSNAVRDILLYSESKPTLTPTTAAELESTDSDLSIHWKDTPTKLSYMKKYVIKLEILKKIIKLSNPGTKARLYNTRMVTNCLDILKVLAEYSDEIHIHCLLPVLSEECLQNCLEHDQDIHIVIHSLILFKTLVKSNQVVSSLCSNATGCVLLTVYNLCLTKRFNNAATSDRLTVSSLIIDSMLYLARSHKGCFTLVLESDCLCSTEIVKCIVSLLHSVMKIHKVCTSKLHRGTNQTQEQYDSCVKNQGTSQNILQTGLYLLHLMCQCDTEFTNRHIPVQHKYVQLICGMTHILRNMENNDAEMNAVQDLWDFNQDDSELSQDTSSDSDEHMDQT
ncbi:hypothetical protein ACF0H5_007697 [Mactra antiquata]